MYRPRIVLLKTISRYLSPAQYKELCHELGRYERVTDPLFVAVLMRHFDMERWRLSPLIKQDLWLYNYFAYEYTGKLKCKGLLRKYTESAFYYDDADFFKAAEALNQKKPPLPKGVKFIKHEPGPTTVNHQFAPGKEPMQR
jgi:hypothetical protein